MKIINDAKYELKKISHITQPKLNFRLKLLKCKKKITKNKSINKMKQTNEKRVVQVSC